MEEEVFELGPAGGKGFQMEKKEMSHGRTAGNKGRVGRKCKVSKSAPSSQAGMDEMRSRQ